MSPFSMRATSSQFPIRVLAAAFFKMAQIASEFYLGL